jgi:hypothetical protein
MQMKERSTLNRPLKHIPFAAQWYTYGTARGASIARQAKKRSLTCEEIYDAAIRRCFQFPYTLPLKWRTSCSEQAKHVRILHLGKKKKEFLLLCSRLSVTLHPI